MISLFLPAKSQKERREGEIHWGVCRRRSRAEGLLMGRWRVTKTGGADGSRRTPIYGDKNQACSECASTIEGERTTTCVQFVILPVRLF